MDGTIIGNSVFVKKKDLLQLNVSIATGLF